MLVHQEWITRLKIGVVGYVNRPPYSCKRLPPWLRDTLEQTLPPFHQHRTRGDRPPSDPPALRLLYRSLHILLLILLLLLKRIQLMASPANVGLPTIVSSCNDQHTASSLPSSECCTIFELMEHGVAYDAADRVMELLNWFYNHPCFTV
ncbi:hypothetical protein J1N35_033640 [Gossypium stocksii]|uniref:Uncharacterized protein n=1 Tax=Gossypium stocksii TaxID=47602 RepID=A0A9D3UQJ6_9ROSI|nr:hypothetical protein J1N35_033640 [Gossypium stocksii]